MKRLEGHSWFSGILNGFISKPRLNEMNENKQKISCFGSSEMFEFFGTSCDCKGVPIKSLNQRQQKVVT